MKTLPRPNASPLTQVLLGWLDFIERASAYAQGKGYGAVTIGQEVKLLLRSLSNTPRLAVDIGGNVGEYTAALRSSVPDLEIHTFEPSSTNIEKLRQRFAGDKNISIVPFAASDTAGPATLFSNEPGSGWASLTKRKLEHFNVAFDFKEPIDTVRFEDYWTRTLDQRPVDIVKIDIEGHELAALSGIGEAIKSIRVLQFEFGGCNIDTRTYFRDFWYFFSEHGFDLFRITPLGLEQIRRYRESDEFFSTTNYIAVNHSPV